MSLYPDTSLIVAALTPEAHTARAQAWLGEQAAGSLATGQWTITEISAALSIKIRTGMLDPHGRDRALERWQQFAIDEVAILPITSRLFQSAARLADRADSGLRAGDALHLAAASDANMELWTLDRRFAAAGRRLD